MVRKNINKSKIGGKVSSMMMMSPSFNDSISKPSMVKNIMKTQIYQYYLVNTVFMLIVSKIGEKGKIIVPFVEKQYH